MPELPVSQGEFVHIFFFFLLQLCYFTLAQIQTFWMEIPRVTILSKLCKGVLFNSYH